MGHLGHQRVAALELRGTVGEDRLSRADREGRQAETVGGHGVDRFHRCPLNVLLIEMEEQKYRGTPLCLCSPRSRLAECVYASSVSFQTSLNIM